MDSRILKHAAVLVAGLALAWNAVAQQFPFARVEPYLNEKEIPNAVVFLPPPPEEGTPQFAYDEAQYQWGKTQRVGARALRAIKEETTNVDSMAALFSGAFGRKLSRETTPKTLHLLDRSIRTFRLGASGPKAAYMRLRPSRICACARMYSIGRERCFPRARKVPAGAGPTRPATPSAAGAWPSSWRN